jgi:putative endonuclease
MQERVYYTYIVASRTRSLYIGMSGDLERRVQQHRLLDGDGFTARYRCDRLVWFERFADPLAAITREKELKGWTRAKKIALIERENLTWVDLSANWGSEMDFGSDGKAKADPSLRSG